MSAPDSGPNLIAWWGAGLSTLLALVKFYELWRDRSRVEISYNFTGDPNIGNEILIRNLSNRPQILTYWELLWCSGRWPRRSFESFEGAEYDAGDCRLEAHTTLTLRFAEANYFAWGHSALKGRSIYIRLYFGGRRPTLRKVYAQ